MSFVDFTKNWLNELANRSFQELSANEELGLSLNGENSDYVRFNRSLVRQSTQVEQRNLELTFQSNGRGLNYKISLSGKTEEDWKAIQSLIWRAREESQVSPLNPFLVSMQNNGVSHEEFAGKPLGAEEVIPMICEAASQVDMAGFYASGEMIRAHQNSKGQKHWFSTKNFFFDYSLYTVNKEGENKAVKGVYADSQWNEQNFRGGLQDKLNQLRILERPCKRIAPGNYRVYLAPSAVAEILATTYWRGFGYSTYKRGQSPFQQMVEGKIQLSPLLNLRENFKLGLNCQFNSQGEVAPSNLVIIENGSLKNLLINSKTAKEYGVDGNAASDSESLRSPEIADGALDPGHVLKELKTGIYINNLHYLNWSDLRSARITGVTRYACFWVQEGEILGPIRDLRFDESLYRCWGTELEAITNQSIIDPSVGTYFERETGGRKVPGMLIRDFVFTL